MALSQSIGNCLGDSALDHVLLFFLLFSKLSSDHYIHLQDSGASFFCILIIILPFMIILIRSTLVFVSFRVKASSFLFLFFFFRFSFPPFESHLALGLRNSYHPYYFTSITIHPPFTSLHRCFISILHNNKPDYIAVIAIYYLPLSGWITGH